MKTVVTFCLAGLALTGPTPTAPETDQQAADALVAAIAADAEGNRPALARAVIRLDALGVHALEGAEDPLPRWRRSVKRKPPPLRGRTLGPGFRVGKLLPGKSDSFSQLFLSGKRASIRLRSPDGKQIAMKVTDAQSKPVCDGDTNSTSSCQWIPVFTQRYVIGLSNPGHDRAQYVLVVN